MQQLPEDIRNEGAGLGGKRHNGVQPRPGLYLMVPLPQFLRKTAGVTG